MILVSIGGVITAYYWLHKRSQIRKRIVGKLTLLRQLVPSIESVVDVARMKRYPLKRYRLQKYHRRQFIWIADHFTQVLLESFEKKGTFLFTMKEAEFFTVLRELDQTEKSKVIESIAKAVMSIETKRLHDMAYYSIHNTDESLVFAFTHLENVLDATCEIFDIDAMIQEKVS